MGTVRRARPMSFNYTLGQVSPDSLEPELADSLKQNSLLSICVICEKKIVEQSSA